MGGLWGGWWGGVGWGGVVGGVGWLVGWGGWVGWGAVGWERKAICTGTLAGGPRSAPLPSRRPPALPPPLHPTARLRPGAYGLSVPQQGRVNRDHQVAPVLGAHLVGHGGAHQGARQQLHHQRQGAALVGPAGAEGGGGRGVGCRCRVSSPEGGAVSARWNPVGLDWPGFGWLRW